VDHFLYRDGVLHAEDVPVAEIAAAVGTPFYVYSTATLKRHFSLFDEALAWGDHLVCFAMKSLSNQAVIKLLGNAGAGMDVVSGGEYLRAKAAGVPGERIVFSGVGKTADEMRMALEGGIRQFNVESEPEMIVLDQVAQSLGVVAPITVRVNPDVDAKTHAKIATGKSENKFGIPISRAREVYAMAAKLPGLKVIGIDVHIGSQLTELAPFELAYRKVAEARIANVRRLDSDALKVTTSKRAEPRVPFGQVVERGMLRPGEMLTSPNGKAAKVRADGTLISKDTKGSIHQVGAALEGAPSCNGWTYWHFKRDGKPVPIDVLRQQIRAEMQARPS
jgi:hypothetical protein